MPEGPETHRMSDSIKRSLKGEKILSFKFEHKALNPLKDLKHIAIVDVDLISSSYNLIQTTLGLILL